MAKTKIGKQKAMDLIQASKGRFLTVVFTKKDGTTRTMNCQYTGNTSKLGYLIMKEKGKFRNANAQEITELRLNKVEYSVG